VLDADSIRLTALLPKDAPRPHIGETVTLDWDASDLHLMAGA
jgi:hypothetical protein